jgi:farnesyl-diphosphate farnesyltransferase
VNGDLEKSVLKGVSRSFYLTLRLLPGPMRGAASLAYLLARTSDTLADSAAVPVEERLSCLRDFERSLTADAEVPRWPRSLLAAVDDNRERRLLECCGDLLAWLARLPQGERELVREVVGTIIGGQELDLERFARSGPEHPVALADDAALEDYTWRVAGCVGAFWTKLGFLTIGARFSKAPESVLLERGIAYGKGLQLVNILRDLPADLSHGRCYLPVCDPHDTAQLMETHRRWLARATEWNAAGFSYAETLPSRRLRAATLLPAMIARETLERMHGLDWTGLQTRVKVPRRRVYLAMLRAFFSKVG